MKFIVGGPVDPGRLIGAFVLATSLSPLGFAFGRLKAVPLLT
jgi:hypothetical protein